MSVIFRYIPVPTGNSALGGSGSTICSVYPCTYRELFLYKSPTSPKPRYIPVPTGNSNFWSMQDRQLGGISLYLQGTLIEFNPSKQFHRYIPVPTGNSKTRVLDKEGKPVYPCTYRELFNVKPDSPPQHGISLYLQGTHNR